MISKDDKLRFDEIAIKENAFYLIRQYDKAYYILAKDGRVPSFDLDNKFKYLIETYGSDFVKFVRNVNSANYQKMKRLSRKIECYLKCGKCLFITLNFSDECLQSTDIKTRRKYVSRFLKSKSDHYVANIDFGSDKTYVDRKGNIRQATKREHYHCLVLLDWIEFKWQFGQIDVERVVKTSDTKKMAEYITKLTRHANKIDGVRQSYIYSRDKENIDWDSLT